MRAEAWGAGAQDRKSVDAGAVGRLFISWGRSINWKGIKRQTSWRRSAVEVRCTGKEKTVGTHNALKANWMLKY